jgi:hypothetical protein
LEPNEIHHLKVLERKDSTRRKKRGKLKRAHLEINSIGLPDPIAVEK